MKRLLVLLYQLKVIILIQPKHIEEFSEIINNYDHLILDQWGVMHNGEEGFKTAINCVKTLYEKKINGVPRD